MEESEASSSSSRLKFLCSYGGRILPRPSDNHLRYVGGDTRVLTLPSPITFTDLKEKIAVMLRSDADDVLIKYQLLQEDLDTLVSVKNDEDLSYMIHEYHLFSRRLRSPTATSSPLFRLFLFPPPLAAATDPAASPRQRYLDAVNGGLPLPIPDPSAHPQRSPTSADCLFEAAVSGARRGGGGMGMQRVRSTPNLGGGAGNGGSQTTSPTAYRKPGAPFGYGGPPGLRIGGGGGGGGFRQEVGYGCGCGCACAGPQLMRKYVCSPSMVAEGSPPPRRGNQRFHVAPPLAAPMRKVVWE